MYWQEYQESNIQSKAIEQISVQIPCEFMVLRSEPRSEQ